MDDEKKNKGTALVPTQAEIIETTDDLLAIAQRRVEFVGKLIDMSLARTSYLDWVNQQGKPYLLHSGAEKVARLFGVKLSDVNSRKEWTEDSTGRYYIYVTTGRASLPGNYDSIEALGTCGQRDKFFAWETLYKDGKKIGGKWKDTGDIDETNVMKASYSNFVVNAITHLLGLRNLTWEQLEKAKIDIKKILKVEYQDRKPAAEGTTGTPPAPAKPAESPATAKEPPPAAIKNPAPDSEERTLDQKKDEIWAICLEVGGNEEEAGYQLAKLSYFEDKEGKPHALNNKTELMRPGIRLKWTDLLLHKAHELKKSPAPQPEEPPDDGCSF
jgi:hypothetical protein